MKEIMIPTYNWNNEDWVLRKTDNIIENLKYCDGRVKNVIFEITNLNNVEKDINEIFNKYNWINKIMLVRGEETIKILKRK